MRQAIIETVTRTLTHYPAPLDGDGAPILPEGDGYEVVDLSDADTALIGQTNARYSVDTEGRLVVTPVAVEPAVDPDAEQAELDAGIGAATTITQLKAALLGSRGGRVKARPGA